MRSAFAYRLAHAVLACMALAVVRAEGDEEESDSASCSVSVEHASGRVCGAALISIRTALTSARCALDDSGGEVWARGAGGVARRAVRVAVAGGGETTAAGEGWSAAAAARDLALLELEDALPGAQSILLAKARSECEPAPADSKEQLECYVVRALGLGRLRIEELTLAAASVCWGEGAPVPERGGALCLEGPQLCKSDWGAGVVCGGKLCGVVSTSRGAGGTEANCGAPHAAASVPRWRRFLHCAHTRGACGRDGECAQLCTERWLPDEAPLSLSAETRALQVAPARTGAPADTSLPATATALEIDSGRSPAPSPAPSRSLPPAPLRTSLPSGITSHPTATPRHALEFEPNRADFTMRPTRVVLKAGEYGDNAADYAAPVDAVAVGAPDHLEEAPPTTGPAARPELGIAAHVSPLASPPTAAPPPSPAPLNAAATVLPSLSTLLCLLAIIQ